MITPLAIKETISSELDRLASLEVLKKVDHTEWAVPIVLVPKSNGKFRIYGNYKITVNDVLEIDQYPFLKLNDLFATLTWAEKFTVLDLSQAYQQMVL